MKRDILRIIMIITGVLGVALTPIGIIVESVPFVVGGFVLILICSGLIWARHQAELKEIEKEEQTK